MKNTHMNLQYLLPLSGHQCLTSLIFFSCADLPIAVQAALCVRAGSHNPIRTHCAVIVVKQCDTTDYISCAFMLCEHPRK